MRLCIALMVLLLVPSVASAQARIALLIGNQGYAAKVGRLKNPHSDVLLVGAALRSLGFKVTELKDADYRSTDAAIKRHIAMVRREGQGAISFVYYSGHGAADPDTKINYLTRSTLPMRTTKTSGTTLSTSTRSWRTCAPKRQVPPTTSYLTRAAMSSI